MVAIDIINSVRFHSTNESDQIEILNMCNEIDSMNLNVGSNQLIRSILILTDYHAQRMKGLIEKKFGGDPRDILVEANKKEPSLNYGNNVFDN